MWQVDGFQRAGAVFWVPDVTKWKQKSDTKMITALTPTGGGHFGNSGIHVLGDKGLLIPEPREKVRHTPTPPSVCILPG